MVRDNLDNPGQLLKVRRTNRAAGGKRMEKREEGLTSTRVPSLPRLGEPQNAAALYLNPL